MSGELLRDSSSNYDENDIKLRQLLDFALELLMENREQFTALSEDLIKDESKRLSNVYLMIIDNLPLKKGAQREFTASTNISIDFRCPKVCAIWKACLNIALRKLEVLHTRSVQGSTYIKYDLFKSEEVVLEFVKSLVQRTDFGCVSISEVEPAIVRTFSTTFDGATVAAFRNYRKCCAVNFADVLRFVQVVRLTVVHYCGARDASEEEEFLVPLADLVERIEIGSPLRSISLSAMKEILSRKCNHLYFKSGPTTITLAQAETLIQFFHHLDKQVFLDIQTECNSMDVQIGEYSLKTIDRWTKYMEIKHLRMTVF